MRIHEITQLELPTRLLGTPPPMGQRTNRHQSAKRESPLHQVRILTTLQTTRPLMSIELESHKLM